MGKTTISWGKSSSSKAISLKQLRKEFLKIRKFEIQNLWQRSIFLGAFIVILISGYGYLLENLLSEYEKWLTSSETQLLIIHVACCLLSFLGSIFSIIWIMMAKASKAWYEIYEKRIDKIEEELQVEDKYRMQPGSPWTLNDSLFSSAPGAYSVSRINILLGQILLVIWRLIFCAHLMFTIYLFLNTNNSSDSPTDCGILIAIVIIIASLFGHLCSQKKLQKIVHSKSIIDPEEEERKREEKREKKKEKEDKQQ